MAHGIIPVTNIINPKAEAEFPTNVEFYAKIETYKNDLVVVGVCRHCGGKIGGHIKIRKVQQRMTQQQIDDTALEYLKKHHNCPRKISQWGDTGLIHRIAPDIVRGWEKLKAAAHKIGKA